MKCLGLHNKPKAEMHPGHKLTGPKEEEEEEEEKEITHSYAPQSVGLLWTSGQLVAETST
jgi:hypothetical protein